MYIARIALQNFRSFKNKTFSFSPTTTVLTGQNATGKTNILEAIFLLSRGKSFRAEKTSKMIMFGEEVGRVIGQVQIQNHLGLRTFSDGDPKLSRRDSSDGGEQLKKLSEVKRSNHKSEYINLEIVLTTGQVMGQKAPIKKYLVNGVSKRKYNFAGNLKIVLFWPQDLELVTDSPSTRRKYLDYVLVQIDRGYRRSLLAFDKGLRRRNKLLEAIREGKSKTKHLEYWDNLLVEKGEYIGRRRGGFVDFINNSQLLITNYKLPNFQLEYDKSPISRVRLEQYQSREITAGATLIGPHRDDFQFRIKNQELRIKNKQKTKDASREPPPMVARSEDEGTPRMVVSAPEVERLRNLSHYGSRGEQRLAILWLKLVELAYIENQTGEKPVLLLDDIFSELDSEHRKIVFNIVGNQQTILTTTDEKFIENDHLKDSRIIEL